MYKPRTQAAGLRLLPFGAQAELVHVWLVAHDCRLKEVIFAEVEQELVRLFPESAGWEWDDSDSGGRVAYLEREPATLAGRVELDDEGRYVRVRTTLESDWRDRVLVLLSGMKLIR